MSLSALFVTTVPVTLEAFLLPYATHFRERGWRVDAMARDATSATRIAEHFDGVFDAPWSRDPLAPGTLFGASRQVRSVVEAGCYDIVHVHTPVAAFVTRFALRRMSDACRPRIVYTAHGFHFYRGQKRAPHALFRGMERMAGRWTDYLVTINAEDHEAARELGTIPEDRVRLIPGIGVDTDRFAPDAIDPDRAAVLRTELGVPADAFMLAMVAELAPVKRHALLLDALAVLATSQARAVHDPDVHLVLVGTGPLESRVREHAMAIGLAERVHWAGYRRDVPGILGGSDALALVSEREGLPRSVLESMACAVPVIGTPTRGIVDAVGEDAGWIAETDEPHAVASAIEAARADAAERIRRGVIGRTRVEQHFALPIIIAAYQELYDEALASRV